METTVSMEERLTSTTTTAIAEAGAGTQAENAKLEAAVAEYVEKARHLKEVLTCRADTDVLLVNVCTAAENLTKPEIAARIGGELMTVQVDEIADAPRMASALTYIAHKINQPTSEVSKDDLEKGRDHRRKFLAELASAVAWGIVPEATLKALRKGNGKADIGHDLMNAVVVFRTYQSQLEGKTRVTVEAMTEAEDLGLRILKQSTAGSPLAACTAAEKSERIQARDRIYTLLVERYAMMHKVGYWVWGRAVNKYVPPLHSAPRRAKAAAEETATVPAPQADAAPATAPAPAPVAAPVPPVPAAPVSEPKPIATVRLVA